MVKDGERVSEFSSGLRKLSERRFLHLQKLTQVLFFAEERAREGFEDADVKKSVEEAARIERA